MHYVLRSLITQLADIVSCIIIIIIRFRCCGCDTLQLEGVVAKSTKVTVTFFDCKCNRSYSYIVSYLYEKQQNKTKWKPRDKLYPIRLSKRP